MAMYNDTGSNLVKFNYSQNPLAQELMPTKKELDMSIWGLPEMDGMENYDLSTEKDIDMETMQGDEYFKTLQNLTKLHSDAKAKNINISNPGKDPNAQQFSKEWLSAYYENIQRGKELKQSLDNRETYNKYVNNPNIVALPLPKGEIITSDIVNNSLLKYDDMPLRSVVNSFKQREQAYTKDQLDLRLQDYEEAQSAILGWVDTQPPQFKDQLMSQVVQPYLKAIKRPDLDQYKIDKINLEKQKQAQNVALKKQALDISQQNANTSRSRLNKNDNDTQDNGYDALFSELQNVGNNTAALNKLQSLSYPINQTSKGKTTTSYVRPTKVSQLKDGTIIITMPNKQTIKIMPDDVGYGGILKNAYDESLKQKQTPYETPKPQVVKKQTVAPKPTNNTKQTNTPVYDWGFK